MNPQSETTVYAESESSVLEALETLTVGDKVNRLKVLASEAAARCGFDPLAYYCQHTGRMIGYHNDDSLALLLHSIDMDPFSSESEELIYDELEIRCLRSMRPSPAWSTLDSKSLQNMTRVDPTGVLVYVFLRCYQPMTDSQRTHIMGQGGYSANRKWISESAMVEHNRHKILLFKRLSVLKKDQFHTLMMGLLECDSRIGLASLMPPKHPSTDSLDRAINALLTPEGSAALVRLMVDHYKRQIDKLDEQNDREVRASRNPMSAQMYLQYWKDNTPKSATQIKQSERAAKKAELQADFNQIFFGGTPKVREVDSAPIKPASAPIKVAPMKAKLSGLNFGQLLRKGN